ncbi:MAG: addiction module antitoxin RelB [Gemmatimonadetes bacterium]|nr:addiction module antitoxin RelB [Gemmatimonadota bacterium]
MTIEQLEAEVLNLPQTERARLAQRLIASLDANAPLERAWYDEAERRLAAVESGGLPEFPADEVLAEFGLAPLR